MSGDKNCFICLQPVKKVNEELIGLIIFLLKYLKIGEKIDSIVCEGCGKNLRKIVKLRLELDYLLGSIQSAILRSNHATTEFKSVRESVIKKCNEEISNRKPQIVLQRIDLPKTECDITVPDFGEDDPSGWNADESSESNDSSHLSPSQPPTKRPFKCDMCNFSFVNSEALKRHKARPHNPKLSSCPFCHKIFTWRQTMLRHVSSVHEKQRRYCQASGCDKSYANISRLTAHYRLEHPGFNYKRSKKCTKCSKIFNSEETFKRHMDTVHLRLKPFKCPTCPMSFTKQVNLRRHVDSVHLHLRPFKCDVCGESFTNQNSLNIHKSKPEHKPKQESLRPKIFPCQICDKTFTKLDNLNRHVSVIHEKQRFSCQAPGCEISYSTHKSLRRHYKLEHPYFTPKKLRKSNGFDEFTIEMENGQSVMKCGLCTATFKRMNTVRLHLAQVHGPKTFVCDICGFATSRKRDLSLHIDRRHNDKAVVKNAQCNFCPKQFASIHLLQQHIRGAHGEKKFKCQDCDYSAPFKHRLYVHIKCKHKNGSGIRVNENEKNVR